MRFSYPAQIEASIIRIQVVVGGPAEQELEWARRHFQRTMLTYLDALWDCQDRLTRGEPLGIPGSLRHRHPALPNRYRDV